MDTQNSSINGRSYASLSISSPCGASWRVVHDASRRRRRRLSCEEREDRRRRCPPPPPPRPRPRRRRWQDAAACTQAPAPAQAQVALQDMVCTRTPPDNSGTATIRELPPTSTCGHPMLPRSWRGDETSGDATHTIPSLQGRCCNTFCRRSSCGVSRACDDIDGRAELCNTREVCGSGCTTNWSLRSGSVPTVARAPSQHSIRGR
mmetsp:Transcript_70239/g.165302  ORF Transcript_70239/g.165302 Transcript_70239/m.165302 type:complete len:205 (+) Transcript_70239:382-996(+)